MVVQPKVKAAAGKKVAVKEEPEEDDTAALAEAALVPPCVVLEKLEELLEKGRIMMRYQPGDGKGWGINGKLGQVWRSFKADEATVCQFVDDTVWTTDDRDGWADAELETLEGLRQKASQFPATAMPQPSALKPRTCRKNVFKYHKGKHAEQLIARAKAKAKAKAAAAAAEKEAAEAVAAAAKAAKEEAAAAAAAAAAEKAAAEQADEIIVEEEEPPPTPAVRKPVTPKIAGAPKPAAPKPAAPKHVAKAATPAAKAVTPGEFLATAKSRLLASGHKTVYKQLLGNVTKGMDRKAITALLADFPDILAIFQQLPKAGGPKQPPPSSTAASTTAEPEEEQDEAPEESAEAKPPPAPRKPPAKPIDLEASILRPVKERGGDVATHLVNLVFGRRRAPATLRQAALKYARNQSALPGFKKLVIIRGPVGSGKSQWAMEQLKIEAGIMPEEEQAARFMHICTADDFHTEFKAGKEEFALDAEKVDDAHARNEAHVKLAMEAGIKPLYVDGCHTQLWEMAAYVKLAKQKEYEITFIDPIEVCVDWDNIETILARNSAEDRPKSKIAAKELVEASIYHFDKLDEIGDEAENVILKSRPGAARPGHAPPANWQSASTATENENENENGKRTLPQDDEPRKVAKTDDTPAPAAAGGGLEGSIARGLLSSFRKK